MSILHILDASQYYLCLETIVNAVIKFDCEWLETKLWIKTDSLIMINHAVSNAAPGQKFASLAHVAYIPWLTSLQPSPQHCLGQEEACDPSELYFHCSTITQWYQPACQFWSQHASFAVSIIWLFDLHCFTIGILFWLGIVVGPFLFHIQITLNFAFFIIGLPERCAFERLVSHMMLILWPDDHEVCPFHEFCLFAITAIVLCCTYFRLWTDVCIGLHVVWRLPEWLSKWSCDRNMQRWQCEYQIQMLNACWSI